MKKDDKELVETHIDLAEDIIVEAAKNSEGKEKKALESAALSLEKAEAEIEDSDK